jgi:hypothetical protein
MRQLVFIFTFIGDYLFNDDGCCRLTQTFAWHHNPLKFFYGRQLQHGTVHAREANPRCLLTGFPLVGDSTASRSGSGLFSSIRMTSGNNIIIKTIHRANLKNRQILYVRSRSCA